MSAGLSVTDAAANLNVLYQTLVVDKNNINAVGLTTDGKIKKLGILKKLFSSTATQETVEAIRRTLEYVRDHGGESTIRQLEFLSNRWGDSTNPPTPISDLLEVLCKNTMLDMDIRFLATQALGSISRPATSNDRAPPPPRSLPQNEVRPPRSLPQNEVPPRPELEEK